MREGKFFERAALGDTNYENRYERSEQLKKIYERPTIDGFKLAEKIQPWKNPADPQKPFPRDLRRAVIRGLKKYEIDPKEEDVKYFTSVGCAPLDDYNGIDAYFKINMPDGERIVTLDVSFKDKDWREIRADVFEQFPDDFQSPPEKPIDAEDLRIKKEWDKKIEEMSSKLVAKLLSSKELQMEKEGAMRKLVKLESIEKIKEKRGVNNHY